MYSARACRSRRGRPFCRQNQLPSAVTPVLYMPARVSMVMVPRAEAFAEPLTPSAAMPAMATCGPENVTDPESWLNCDSAGPCRSVFAVTVMSLFCDLSVEDRGEIEVPHLHVARTDCPGPSTSATSLAHPSPADERRWSATLRRLSGPSSASVNAGVSGRPSAPATPKRAPASTASQTRLQLQHRGRQYNSGSRRRWRPRSPTCARRAIEIQRIVTHGDAARQRVQREIRVRSAERHVADVHRVTNRFVLKRGAGVQPLEPRRHVHPLSRGGIVNHDRSIADADLLQGDGALRPGTVGFLLLPLDEPRDRPRISRAPQVDDRLVHAQLRDRDALRDHLQRVVLDARYSGFSPPRGRRSRARRSPARRRRTGCRPGGRSTAGRSGSDSPA